MLWRIKGITNSSESELERSFFCFPKFGGGRFESYELLLPFEQVKINSTCNVTFGQVGLMWNAEHMWLVSWTPSTLYGTKEAQSCKRISGEEGHHNEENIKKIESWRWEESNHLLASAHLRTWQVLPLNYKACMIYCCIGMIIIL